MGDSRERREWAAVYGGGNGGEAVGVVGGDKMGRCGWEVVRCGWEMEGAGGRVVGKVVIHIGVVGKW